VVESDRMNFLAHAAVARRIDDDPAFVLGAVLPDLLPMAGLPIRSGHAFVPGPDGSVTRSAAGWALHHHVDEVFHELPAFRTGVQALRVELRGTALDTGPRRAVAHVGWELLLDDALADDGATIVAFRDALLLGRERDDSPAWRSLVDRLLDAHPHAPSSTRAIAERVHRAVSRRPRLAFDPAHLDGVTEVLERHRSPIAGAAPGIVDTVTLAAR
jgi:hypothetical protein